MLGQSWTILRPSLGHLGGHFPMQPFPVCWFFGVKATLAHRGAILPPASAIIAPKVRKGHENHWEKHNFIYIFGPAWANMGPSWAPVSDVVLPGVLVFRCLGHLGPSWGHLGPLSGRLEPSRGHFEAILGQLRPFWGYLGPSWGPLWAILGAIF